MTDETPPPIPAVPGVVFPVRRAQPPVTKGSAGSVPALPKPTLRRSGGRLLDPDTARLPRVKVTSSEQPAEREPLQPTTYVADAILLPADASDPNTIPTALTTAAEQIGLRLTSPVPRQADHTSNYLQVPVSSTGDEAPDVWRLVQALREAMPEERRHKVSLNHLLVGTAVEPDKVFRRPVAIDATKVFRRPVDVDNSFAADYSTPGWGGRGPVALYAPPPPRRGTRSVGRRPVVALLDTGLADHAWFATGVERMVVDEDRWVVPAEDDAGKEVHPDVLDPLRGELDPYFGHGTFIAGLVRQYCPDADLLSIKVIPADGVVDEATLLAALDYLVSRQKTAASDPKKARLAIDILSLSLGYYHEDPQDAGLDGPLHERLDRLRSLGVTVIAAAGNDSTTRPFVPAAFANYVDGQVVTRTPSTMVADSTGFPVEEWPPLVSVGALNPSLSIALFSNGGPWVSCYAPGALLVSTTPHTDAPQQPSVVIDQPGSDREPAQWRSSIDPDYFDQFGTWSGTSFSAPIVAGVLASQLLADGASGAKADLASLDPPEMARRARDALLILGFPG